MSAVSVRALRDAALHAAARGWPVFPLRVGEKRPALHAAARCPGTGPCSGPGGHLGWEQRATTDPDRIRTAWSRTPFNIGLATGPAGLVVVDLDQPKGPDDAPPAYWSRRGARRGGDVFALLCADAEQPVPDTLTVQTARGGRHLYFRAPPGTALRNTDGSHGRRGLGWKVDTRAHGGYVVAPGSRTPHGIYRLISDLPAAEIPELPGWLVRHLSPRPPTAHTAPAQVPRERLPRYIAAAVQGERKRVTKAPSGQHKAVLYVAAVALGQLVGGGLLTEQRATDELHAAAADLVTGSCSCDGPEITRTIRNGLDAGRARPRTVRPRPTAPTLLERS